MENLFESSSGVKIFRHPAKPIKYLVLDIDGVILRECGIGELSYSYLIECVKKEKLLPFKSLEWDSIDHSLISSIRQQVKGKSPVEKASFIITKFNPSFSAFSVSDMIAQWGKFHMYCVRRKFASSGYEDYFEADGAGAEIVKFGRKEFRRVFLVTANLTYVAHELMKFVHLDSYFEKGSIYGYTDSKKKMSKGLMIGEIMKENRIMKDEICFVGDGYSDMIAARENGIYAVGVAISEKNGNKLIKEGCQMIVKNTSCYKEIFNVLLKRK